MFLILLVILLVGSSVLTYRYLKIITEDKKAEPSSGNQVEFQHFNDEDKIKPNDVMDQNDAVDRQ